MKKAADGPNTPEGDCPLTFQQNRSLLSELVKGTVWRFPLPLARSKPVPAVWASTPEEVESNPMTVMTAMTKNRTCLTKPPFAASLFT
jgi:hypothetical protein